MDTCHSECIKEGGFSNIRHADYEDTGSEKGSMVLGEGFREIEDGLDVLLRFVVCEQRGLGEMPVSYYFFSLWRIQVLAAVYAGFN